LAVPFMSDILQPTHVLLILVVAFAVLGPKRLPEFSRTVGRGIREFRGAITGESTAASKQLTGSETAPGDRPS
jgi:sec-independent protein translocase protein TatA